MHCNKGIERRDQAPVRLASEGLDIALDVGIILRGAIDNR